MLQKNIEKKKGKRNIHGTYEPKNKLKMIKSSSTQKVNYFDVNRIFVS